MIAFEKGVPVPLDTAGAPPTIETYQLRGLVWIATGIALGIALFVIMPLACQPMMSRRQRLAYREQDMEGLHRIFLR